MKQVKRILPTILVLTSIMLILKPSIESQREIQEAEEHIEHIEQAISEGDIVEGGDILEIDAIDLKLPILHGAVHENMINSVATMTHKKAGVGKNYTIAGHRNLRTGKNFNRLNEVEFGDTIKVRHGKEEFIYQVNDKFIVEPDEVNILEDTGKTEITLITCYPISISTHRLVIKGEVINEN